MRQPAPWFNSASDRVLEALRDGFPVALSVADIVTHFELKLADPPSQTSVRRALEPLETYGLVERPDPERNFYLITDRGLAYLDEEIDASELSESD